MNGHLLASTVVPHNEEAALDHGFRYGDIAPLTLPAGGPGRSTGCCACSTRLDERRASSTSRPCAPARCRACSRRKLNSSRSSSGGTFVGGTDLPFLRPLQDLACFSR